MPNIAEIEYNSHIMNKTSFLAEETNENHIKEIIKVLKFETSGSRIYNLDNEFNEIKKILKEAFLVDEEDLLNRNIEDVEKKIEEHEEDIQKITDNIISSQETHQSEESIQLYEKVLEKYHEILEKLVESINDYNYAIATDTSCQQISLSDFPCKIVGTMVDKPEAENVQYFNILLQELYEKYYLDAKDLLDKYGGGESINRETNEHFNDIDEIVDTLKENLTSKTGWGDYKEQEQSDSEKQHAGDQVEEEILASAQNSVEDTSKVDQTPEEGEDDLITLALSDEGLLDEGVGQTPSPITLALSDEGQLDEGVGQTPSPITLVLSDKGLSKK